MAVDVETRRTDCGMVSKLRTRNLVLGGVVGESIEKEQQTVQRFAVLIGQQSHDRLQRRLTPLRRNICIRHTHTHTHTHRQTSRPPNATNVRHRSVYNTPQLRNAQR